MNIAQWYAVSVAAVSACLLIHRIGSLAANFFVSRFQVLALKKLVYPLLRRRYFGSVTRFQGLMVGSYIVINGFCMGIGIKNTGDLLLRSGTMAAINMIPLFLGGRTSVLANFLGISVHTYYLAHHWIGRVVILQSLLHVVLVIATGKPWTFDSSQISGISVSLSQMGLEFLTIRPVGFSAGAAPPSLIVLRSQINHIRIPDSIFIIVDSESGLATFEGSVLQSGAALEPQDKSGCDNALYGHLHTERRWRHENDNSDGNGATSAPWASHPFVVAWWDAPMAARSLSFLIRPQSGITSELITRKSVRTVTLDGPYGKDLHLDSYETVILVAKGIGIAGILPYIRHMTDRKVLPDEYWAYQYRRGLITRKIDVYWVLEDNDQEEWASDWIKDLHELDGENLILTFSCFYPYKETKPPPVPNSSHWRFLYQKEALPIIESLMLKRIQRSPGKTKVAVCAQADFSDSIRGTVLKAMNEYQDIEFAETEFQPQGVRQAYPGIHKLERDDVEMHRMVTRSRPTRMLRSSRLSSQDDEKRLVKTHSGMSSKLETLDEKSERSMDLGPQSPTIRRDVADIV
ncbi:uncharacterized protein PAC_05600 [Phialocephala subalpina]|uniref:FAD-binding FR-type domain-containing protein n=1 Tax=Phialocephala subalpina TaxID=576137 RepID=A0A1L7WSG4_9HELO|nr:uncharacterized protein PAC_05600 [Phialocephala subalpina]